MLMAGSGMRMVVAGWLVAPLVNLLSFAVMFVAMRGDSGGTLGGLLLISGLFLSALASGLLVALGVRRLVSDGAGGFAPRSLAIIPPGWLSSLVLVTGFDVMMLLFLALSYIPVIVLRPWRPR